jgi:septum site-determining protein MinC
MAAKPKVTIKGTKDGLVFYLDDRCAFDALLAELKEKLRDHPHFLNGPPLKVTVHLGYRYLTEEEEQQVKNLIYQQGNLAVSKMESLVVLKEELEKARKEAEVKMVFKTVRSGQVIQTEGHLLILGDVNPGGLVEAGGHIFVLGALRGMAHAGTGGNRKAVIAASILSPTQLRISSIISRPLDGTEQYEQEFAYIDDQGQISIDKLYHLLRVRPDLKALYSTIDHPSFQPLTP